MNYERIYKYRIRGMNPETRLMTWDLVARFIYKKLGNPERVLDPAAGLCEFINAIPAKERWAIDLNDKFISQKVDANVKKIIGNNLEVDIPQDYFDGIFISNFLEHLHSQEEVAFLLEKMYKALRTGGRIAVMGPNFRFAARQYFDFADHTVILSDISVAEHLYGAGFDKISITPRFLPLTFRDRIPVNKFLVNTYLAMPFAWRFYGKQFLLIAQK
jgi:SAM-dependent methyltransferase